MSRHRKPRSFLARWWWLLVVIICLCVAYADRGHPAPASDVHPVQSTESLKVPQEATQPRAEPVRTPPPIVTVQSYKVVPGDNLTSIAQAHCGNADDWAALQKGNKITDPGELTIGQVLVLTC